MVATARLVSSLPDRSGLSPAGQQQAPQEPQASGTDRSDLRELLPSDLGLRSRLDIVQQPATRGVDLGRGQVGQIFRWTLGGEIVLANHAGSEIGANHVQVPPPVRRRGDREHPRSFGTSAGAARASRGAEHPTLPLDWGRTASS
jgi:hypothetical protein